jgi:hypothetical protein
MTQAYSILAVGFGLALFANITALGEFHVLPGSDTGSMTRTGRPEAGIDQVESAIRQTRRAVSNLDYETETKGRTSDRTDFDCDRRLNYVRQKLKAATTPRELIEKLAKNPPQVLILGNNHSLLDDLVWYGEIEKFYKEKNPAFDCVFEEGDPNPIEQTLYFAGPSYLKKFKTVRKAVEAFARDYKIPIEIWGNPEESSDDVKYKLGENTYVETESLQWYFENKVRLIKIDDQSSLAKRDLFMAAYIQKLFDSGQCHFAVANLGKLHLFPQKVLLEKKGITTFTVGFEALNANERRFSHPALGGAAMVKNPGFLDFEGCPIPDKEKPTRPIAILTQDAAGPLVDKSITRLRWNTFDAHIIAPVAPTGPANDFADKAVRILSPGK